MSKKEKEYVNIMIDIETLGKRPGSVILSIGAVEFDINTGKIIGEFYAVIDLESSIHDGLTVDSSTLLWWMSNDRQEARNDLLKIYDEDEESYDLCEALIDLSGFIESSREDDKDLRVWANPPTFDLMILESAYDILNTEVPWKHYEMMDLRTLKKIYKGDKPKFEIKEGVKHNALYDAKLQAMICSHIWNKIGGRE